MIQIDMPMPSDCYSCWIRQNMGCKTANASGWMNNKRDDDCTLKELVRCKDCAYSLFQEGMQKGHIFCTKPFTERWQAVKPNDWFCADGIRKDS